MRRGSACVVCMAILLQRTDLAANDLEGGKRLFVRAGIGGGAGMTRVGEETNTAAGPVGNLQIGLSGRRAQLALDLEVQPFRVENPLRREAYRAAHLLPSVQVYFGKAYLRGGLGLARLWYSGADVFRAQETNLAYGLSAGYERHSRRIRPGVEVVGRWTHSPDGELRARLLAVQVMATWLSGTGREKPAQ